ncbi:serine/threonine protein kinase [Methylicorpusculum oleiharenae]|uniref:serine/threonine-protein kinase n=1 Tax=Methylicorpusculum oleiharenae TaxID=1338687 RepID=UPI001356EBD3|nr:serine/threonine-protein kinase [Methylicorpusculum oleiharenae]MCD2453803.1 serine/threonine protein kinase [Methylicorpusculum oleiharenae]
MTLPARYKPILPPISGGFGHAIICEDQVLQRKVAIKKINHSAHLNRLIDEVVALQEAKSKHVVEIYDVLINSTGTDISIVEEYLPGSDLLLFAFNPLNLEEFYKLGFQVATGIAEIHARMVVHRDIKPNNMKYDAAGYIRIFDFGLAKTTTLPTSTVTLTGTPGYMAPELFNSPPIIDKPIDIYAFGAMMFDLITGNLPPCAMPWPQKPVALAPADGIGNKGLSNTRIAHLIDKCLAVPPNDRPSAAEIAIAFQRELLYGQHKATLVSSSQTLILDTIGKSVKASHQVNSIEVAYDGFDFNVGSVIGHVYVNNQNAVQGMVLSGSHVITLGSSGLRKFVTFDVSHPEVKI